MNNQNHTFCRVCGYDLQYPIWGEDNLNPTFDICSCCGVEFGYEDISIYSIQNFRSKWLSLGAKWFNSKLQPQEWDIDKQFKNIPKKFK